MIAELSGSSFLQRAVSHTDPPQQRPEKTAEQGRPLDNAQDPLSDQPPLSSQHLSALTSYASGGWPQPGAAFG